jgi:hypothetical protein
VVEFPHLGTPDRRQTHIIDYVPGRTINLAFLPALGSASTTTSSSEGIQTGRSRTETSASSAQVGSVSFRMTVTDASIEEVGGSLGAGPGQPSSVGELPADVGDPHRPGSLGRR